MDQTFAQVASMLESMGLIAFLTFAWLSERRERQELQAKVNLMMDRMRVAPTPPPQPDE